MTMTTTTARPSTPDRSPRAAYLDRLRDSTLALGYLVLGLPLAVTAVVGVSILLSLGIGLAVLWVGLPVIVISARYARAFAQLERRMQASMLGRDVPEAVYASSQETGWRRWLAVLRDPQSWLDQLWTLVHTLVASVTFSIAVTWVVGTLGSVLGPIAVLVLDRVLGDGYNPLLELIGIHSIPAEMALHVAVGIGLLLTLPTVVPAVARWQARTADALLNHRSRTQREIGALRSTRDAARIAEADQLRRLERDIHDGPQQRLVRLNMDLARARRMAATDPERAQMLLAEAMEQTQETLGELRMLSRGIAPPLLVDRGLDAAVTEVAGRSVVPVTVRGGVPRLPGHVEAAAYYVVSECLANINKHSGASAAEVTLEVLGDELVVGVRDDGRGGADPAKGHGLAGLVERLRSVGGRLEVDSPEGGPTMVQAVLPCAS